MRAVPAASSCRAGSTAVRVTAAKRQAEPVPSWRAVSAVPTASCFRAGRLCRHPAATALLIAPVDHGRNQATFLQPYIQAAKTALVQRSMGFSPSVSVPLTAPPSGGARKRSAVTLPSSDEEGADAVGGRRDNAHFEFLPVLRHRFSPSVGCADSSPIR